MEYASAPPEIHSRGDPGASWPLRKAGASGAELAGRVQPLLVKTGSHCVSPVICKKHNQLTITAFLSIWSGSHWGPHGYKVRVTGYHTSV